ncbi:glutaminyl-peptide cyclotransferase [Salegentibacter chungangensis]|uniref:Glutaminyl-peptide cyclotransferase n=1 Tax=Salegentibacter chungangensis TaxID=1335724 RepID=A0ABW3NSS4_9FLAO
MMNKFNFLLLFSLTFLFFSCGSNSGKKTSDFSLKTASGKTEFQLGESVRASLENKKEREIDSVQFYFENKRISSARNSVAIKLKEHKLGNQQLKAVVFYEGETDTVSQNLKIYNDSAPVTYTYNIVNTYPHDMNAYTQGLEFYNDSLYESTGQYGSSTLRMVDLESGEVLQETKLPDNYFGEGLTIWKDKIYQLSWRQGEGFIYNRKTLKKTGTFSYNNSKEGWGLTHDGEKLYKSDGTEKIWILDPETLAEKDFIQTVTNRTISTRLNELEWVDGKIYANTYQKDGVAIINPENGAIEGLIDFRGLREKVTQHDKLDVLNGIAYNPNTKRLYVTGKNWDKIFEVEIVEK